jgi:hypothetical protein
MKKLFKKHVQNEKGSQAIEFLAMFPLVILGMLIIWQVALIAYSIVVAESAARDGARAAAIHDEEWKQVARNSAFGVHVASVTGGPGDEEARVEVKVKAPIISLPLIDEMKFDFTADAVMPMEEKADSDE